MSTTIKPKSHKETHTKINSESISVQRDEDGVAILTLASPHGVNQLNQALLDPLKEHLQTLITADDTQGIMA